MLDYRPRELQVSEGRVIGSLRRDDARLTQRTASLISRLHQEAAGDGPRIEVQLSRPWTGLQDTQLRAGGHRLKCRLVERGGDDHFEERSNQRLGNGRVDRPVEGDDPAEGRSPIAVERAIEGLSRTLSEGHAAGVRVLDDGHRNIRKVRHERPGGLSVEQVVVGELEPLPLLRAGDTAAGGGPVEGGRLMGILAVAEVAHLVAAEGEVLGQGRRRGWPAKVLTDGGVVGGGMTERDRGKMTPK